MSPSVERESSRLAYQPALDGVRAIAVAMVLLFHAGFRFMAGGYVGVSVFFTLSGFLITTLLVHEFEETGSVSAPAFYGRRLRRLLPASLACIVGVAIAARAGVYGRLDSLRGDLVSAVLQVANWRSLVGHVSYADMVAHTVGRVGPVDHFWSLAVEEQFYWLWPLVFVVVVRRGGVALARSAITALAAIAAAAAPVVAGVWGGDAAYWATPARLGEILIGAALAMWMYRRTVPARCWLLAPVGLVAVVACGVLWPSANGPAYRGWLPVFALGSAALLLGLQAPSVVQRLLAWRPLVALGRVSYGVYLYHWPIYAALDSARVHLTGGWLFAVRIAATMAVAALSYRFIEQPIRTGAGPRVWRIAPAALATTLVVALVVAPAGAARLDESLLPAAFATASSAADSVPQPSTHGSSATIASGSTGTPSSAGTVVSQRRPLRVLLMGDSTMVGFAAGVKSWAADHADDVRIASVARVGCGLIRGSRLVGDAEGRFNFRCEQVWTQALPAVLRSGVPDVVVVMVSVPDAMERLWNTAEGVVRPSDPRFVERLQVDYEATYTWLRSNGVRRIEWVVPPLPAHRWLGWMQSKVTPADWDPMVRQIEALGMAHGDVVHVVRLDEWMRANEPHDGVWRYDGLHFDEASSRVIMDRYIGPLVLAER